MKMGSERTGGEKVRKWSRLIRLRDKDVYPRYTEVNNN
jgi:hypothetical protein